MPKPSAPAITADLLMWLGSITGATFDESRARDAIRNNTSDPDTTPEELFAKVAKELFMHADTECMALKDAVWRARRDTPVVLRSASGDRWIVVTYAGWFLVR